MRVLQHPSDSSGELEGHRQTFYYPGMYASASEDQSVEIKNMQLNEFLK